MPIITIRKRSIPSLGRFYDNPSVRHGPLYHHGVNTVGAANSLPLTTMHLQKSARGGFTMKKAILIVSILVVLAITCSSARLRSGSALGLGFRRRMFIAPIRIPIRTIIHRPIPTTGIHAYYYSPYRVYAAPQPVYVAPPPGYVYPAPANSQPVPQASANNGQAPSTYAPACAGLWQASSSKSKTLRRAFNKGRRPGRPRRPREPIC